MSGFNVNRRVKEPGMAGGGVAVGRKTSVIKTHKNAAGTHGKARKIKGKK